jgi:hypothetical protein
MHREVVQSDGTSALREPSEAYMGEFTTKSDVLRLENTIFWDENAETAES